MKELKEYEFNGMKGYLYKDIKAFLTKEDMESFRGCMEAFVRDFCNLRDRRNHHWGPFAHGVRDEVRHDHN